MLGPEILLMGSVASARFPLEDIARPSLRRLAEETGESAFFSIRRGAETVCLLREEGSFPVRSFVLHEGVRFPLGVASAGTAIMAFLPEAEQEELLAGWAAHAGGFAAAHTEPLVRENLAKTRQAGYSVNPGLVLEGSWGMGAAVFDQRGRPAWALSLTGIEPRFKGERQEMLGRLLMDEAHRISTLLQGATRPWRWDPARRGDRRRGPVFCRPGAHWHGHTGPERRNGPAGLKVPGGLSGTGYFHQVSKMVTGTVRLWRVRRYLCSMDSATASGTSRPSR